MNINPGLFKKKIKFYAQEGSRNKNGYPTDPILLLETRASVTRMSGKEVTTTGTKYSEATTRFFTRYNKAITSKLILEYQNEQYDIKYVNDYADKKQYMEILAVKREVTL